MSMSRSTAPVAITVTPATSAGAVEVKSRSARLKNLREKVAKVLRIRNHVVREILAEIFGTFIFVSFGLGSIAQYIFQGRLDFFSVNIAFGFGLTLGILVSNHVSGGHLNPAVSLSMLLLGRIGPLQFVCYSLAQLFGAFLAAVMVFLTYYDELRRYPQGMHSLETASIFATFPVNADGTFSSVFDQTFATFLFVVTLLAITDKKNCKLAPAAVAALIGISLIIIGTSFGYLTGYAINPARDLGPRIFTAIAGWGSLPFVEGSYFFWIPIVGPFFGSVIGTLIYFLFISNHWTSADEADLRGV